MSLLIFTLSCGVAHVIVSETTPEAIRKAVEETVRKLGRIPDLFVIHWPQVIEEGKIGEAWTILEGLVNDGTLEGASLGVSNFRPQDLEDIFKVAKIKPVINRTFYLAPQSFDLGLTFRVRVPPIRLDAH